MVGCAGGGWQFNRLDGTLAVEHHHVDEQPRHPTADPMPAGAGRRRRTPRSEDHPTYEGRWRHQQLATSANAHPVASARTSTAVRSPSNFIGSGRARCDRHGRAERSPARTTLHWSNADLEVHSVVVGPYDNNVFVIRCRETGDSVLIDAANEHEQLLEFCSRLDVRRVLETHGHWDHIQAVPALREAGYEVAVTAADAPMLKDVGYDVFLDDAEVIEVGNLRLHAIHNPGHTPGSISFQVEGTPLLFTGDTLFPGGPGNTKFDGGDFGTIIESIDNRLFTFPANTVVLPGHGVDTTIGAERPHLAGVGRPRLVAATPPPLSVAVTDRANHFSDRSFEINNTHIGFSL